MYIGLMQSARYCCKILMRPEFSGQVVQKHSYVKLNENASSGSRVVSCGQTDRQANRRDESNNHFS